MESLMNSNTIGVALLVLFYTRAPAFDAAQQVQFLWANHHLGGFGQARALKGLLGYSQQGGRLFCGINRICRNQPGRQAKATSSIMEYGRQQSDQAMERMRLNERAKDG